MKNTSTQFWNQMQCLQLGQLNFLYSSVDICVCLMCLCVFVCGVKFIVRLLSQAL